MNDEIKKERSPASPRMALADAIEMTRKLHTKAGKSTIRPEVAVQAMGYGGLNGAALAALGALKQYGLVEGERGASIGVSALAIRLIHPLSQQQEMDARKEAAMHPRVFSELMHGGYNACAEDVLSNHLVQYGYTPEGAKRAASIFKENVEFAKLAEGSIIENVRPITTSAPPLSISLQPTQVPDNEELPIPIGNGRMARIPYPMSEQNFDLLLKSLQLWKGELVKKDNANSDPQ